MGVKSVPISQIWWVRYNKSVVLEAPISLVVGCDGSEIGANFTDFGGGWDGIFVVPISVVEGRDFGRSKVAILGVFMEGIWWMVADDGGMKVDGGWWCCCMVKKMKVHCSIF